MKGLVATVFCIIVAIVILVHLVHAYCGRTTGRGVRVGTIVKCADEGTWNPTHEIEIIRGGMNGANGGFGVKPFFATVTDDREWQIAQQYFNSQREVEVSYVEILWSPWKSQCNGEDESCAYVTAITPRQ